MIDEGPSPEDIARFGGEGDDDGDDVMYCPDCGAEVFQDVGVCPKCLNPIGASVARRRPVREKTKGRFTSLIIVLVIIGFFLVFVLQFFPW